MQELELGNKKRALVIVAHPDDETIWMGGALLRFPRVRWTILSLCRQTDDDRRPKFFRVCARYGAKGAMADLDDEDKLSVKETLPIIKSIIKKAIGRSRFDYLFTHDENGEYGHPRHRGAHRVIAEMLQSGGLDAKSVFYFSYVPAGKHKIAAGKAPDFFLKLTREEFKEKKRIVAEMYGYAYNGIDVGYCLKTETFRAG